MGVGLGWVSANDEAARLALQPGFDVHTRHH